MQKLVYPLAVLVFLALFPGFFAAVQPQFELCVQNNVGNIGEVVYGTARLGSTFFVSTNYHNIHKAATSNILVWTKTSGFGNLNYYIRSFHIDESTQTLYLTAGTLDGQKIRLYKSTDGSSWELLQERTGPDNYFWGLQGIGSEMYAWHKGDVYKYNNSTGQFELFAQEGSSKTIKSIGSFNGKKYYTYNGTLGSYLREFTSSGTSSTSKQISNSYVISANSAMKAPIEAYDGYLYIGALGQYSNNGLVFRTSDLVNYSMLILPTITPVAITSYNNSGITVLSGNGEIFRSWDGVTWKKIIDLGDQALNAMVASDYRNVVLVSNNQFPNSITSVFCNASPIPVVAQKNVSGTVNQTITLDASQSYDIDGLKAEIKPEWVQKSGSTVTLSSPLDLTTSFTPTQAGQYVFELRLNDSSPIVLPDANESTETVTVNVSLANQFPTANAGQDKQCQKSQSCSLSASSSTDPDNDALSFSWSGTGPAAVALQSASTVTPSFTPTAFGQYTLTVTVSDGKGGTATDSVAVTVANSNPVLSVGSDKVCVVGMECELSVTASDPENSALSFVWSKQSGTGTVQWVGGNAQQLSNTLPTAKFSAGTIGNYQISIRVNDADGGSTTGTIGVTFVANAQDVVAINQPPTANAGEDKQAIVNETVVLDGSQSSDPESQLVLFSWVQASGLPVSIANSSTARASFTPAVDGQYVFSLTVTDSNGARSSDNIAVVVGLQPTAQNGSEQVAESGDSESVQQDIVQSEGQVRDESAKSAVAENRAPVLEVSSDLNGEVGEKIVLNSIAVDPEGAEVMYFWRQVEGPAAALSNANTSSPSFVPLEQGEYVFEVISIDSNNKASDPKVVTVKIETPAAEKPEPERLSLPSLSIVSEKELPYVVAGVMVLTVLGLVAYYFVSYPKPATEQKKEKNK